jgi:two-component system response regulator DesR
MNLDSFNTRRSKHMRVFIADAEPEVRNALRLLLGQEPSVHVVGETGTAWGLPARVEAASPDLVLLDWELPGPPLVDLLPAVRALCCTRIIALSARPEAERRALAAGADAFVGKTEPPTQLLAILKEVHA